MIDLSTDHFPKELDGDDVYANYVTVLLGQIINYSFGQKSETLTWDQWFSLKNDLQRYKSGLPLSFKPITSHDHSSIWTLNGWHGGF